MDPMLFAGLGLALLSIVASTLIDGNSLGVLIGPSSFVLVVFGTVGAAVMGFRLADVKRFVGVFMYALKGSPPDPDEAVTALAELAEVARKDGMLALEGRLGDLEDPFLRQGLQLVVDGQGAEQVRDALEIDVTAMEERHGVGISFFKSMAAYAPTLGMIGTVIGLINVLGNLDSPDQLGTGMALALLTTLYGVLFANLVFKPVAERLSRLHALEAAAKEIAIDGVLSVQAGASPRVLVERLETYLPPERRIGLKARSGGGAPAAEAA